VGGGYFYTIYWLENRKRFATHGDSGSLVIILMEDSTMVPLGIHTKSDEDRKFSFSIPIEICLDEVKEQLKQQLGKKNLKFELVVLNPVCQQLKKLPCNKYLRLTSNKLKH